MNYNNINVEDENEDNYSSSFTNFSEEPIDYEVIYIYKEKDDSDIQYKDVYIDDEDIYFDYEGFDVDDKDNEKDNENLEACGIPTIIISPPFFSEDIIEISSPPFIPTNLPPLMKRVNNTFKPLPKNEHTITSNSKTFRNATASSVEINKNIIISSKNNIKYNEDKMFLKNQIEKLKKIKRVRILK
jgi:hypothetical protein